MKKISHIILFAIQYCFYYTITPIAFLIYRKKRPWIISERGNDARDNGFAMFKYLKSEQKYINSFFIINKKSVDYLKLKPYGKIVKYKSLKHWLLYRVAECRMSTHLAAFAPGNYIGEWFKHHKQKGINVFLQHGITHNEFPSNYYEFNGSNLFICGAKPEYDHISKNCHYPKSNVVYTGFSRFDELLNYETKNQILVMPSWRNYLQGLPREDFIESKYFKAYDSLLRNKELNNILEKENIKLVFYVHYSLQQYSGCFNNYCPNIVIADFNHYDVQTLLKESKLLITDYSSIFFDFAYMKKPLIYYQFDKEEFYNKHYKKSYFNHDINGFGPVLNNMEDVINKTIELIRSNFKLDENFVQRIHETFILHDGNNSSRIFNEIIKYMILNRGHHTKKGRETYLTFTGDDYGRNCNSTIGINMAFKEGIIQQTSLMVNRSEEDLKFSNEIPKNKIVFHFNITEGYQSYGNTSSYSYSVNNNDSISKKIIDKKTYFILKKNIRNTISKEIKSQIEKYKSIGYNCIAFDSHGHIHNRLPIARVIAPTLKKYGFIVARIPSNVHNDKNLIHSIYKRMTIRFYRKSFVTADYFCSVYDLIHLNLAKYHGKVIEIMTHPFVNNDVLINRNDINFSTINLFIQKYNVTVIDYNDLIRLRMRKKNE